MEWLHCPPALTTFIDHFYWCAGDQICEVLLYLLYKVHLVKSNQTRDIFRSSALLAVSKGMCINLNKDPLVEIVWIFGDLDCFCKATPMTMLSDANSMLIYVSFMLIYVNFMLIYMLILC